MYTSSLAIGTSIFLVLVIHLFSIFARSVRVLFDIENRSSKTGMMLAICTDLSSLVDDSLDYCHHYLLSLSFYSSFLFLKSLFQLAFWSYLPLMIYYSNSLVIIVEKEMKR